MKLLFSYVMAFLLAWLGSLGASLATEPFVLFSPQGSISDAIVRQIDASTSEILVAAYHFSSPPISQSLVRASLRGVSVFCILDRNQEFSSTSSGRFLKSNGIHIKVDRLEKIFHNKYIVIDRSTFITGSYNFTFNAENKNAENIVFIFNSSLSADFVADFFKHWDHSTVFIYRPNLSRTFNRPRTPLSFSFFNPHRKEFLRWRVSLVL